MPPILEKTTGIVLRIHPFSNTSQMVAWLTPDAGRVVTSVKGACRPRSMSLGQYDLYYTCEVLYYAHASSGVHILRECCPLALRRGLRSDWRANLCASYLCDLADRLSSDHSPPPELYPLVDAALDDLAGEPAGTPPPSASRAPRAVHALSAVLLAFELRLLPLLGLVPDLDGCPHCLETLETTGVRFSIPDGRLVCPRCAPKESPSPEAAVLLPKRLLSLLRLASRTPSYAPVLFDKLSPADTTVLRRFLGIFLHYHLDVRLDARSIAWDGIFTTL